MRIYTVRVGKQKLKEFATKEEAQKFMLDYVLMQNEYVLQQVYLDEALEKSDLKESKEVLKHIMEL